MGVKFFIAFHAVAMSHNWLHRRYEITSWAVGEGQEPLTAQVGGAILKRVAEDDLVLPALPWVLRAAAHRLGESPFQAAAVGEAIAPDVLAVARLLRVANSSAYSDGTAVTAVVPALERLGARIVRIFLDDAGCDRMLASREPQINPARQRAWEHGVAVGLVARDLAGFASNLGHGTVAESAYLGGLLHDLGKPVVAALLIDSEHRLASAGLKRWLSVDQWRAVVMGTHATVGRLLAVKWGFPAAIRQCIAETYSFDRWTPYAISNFVCVANALVEKAGFDLGPPADEAAMNLVLSDGPKLLGISASHLDRACRDLEARVANLVGRWPASPQI